MTDADDGSTTAYSETDAGQGSPGLFLYGRFHLGGSRILIFSLCHAAQLLAFIRHRTLISGLLLVSHFSLRCDDDALDGSIRKQINGLTLGIHNLWITSHNPVHGGLHKIAIATQSLNTRVDRDNKILKVFDYRILPRMNIGLLKRLYLHEWFFCRDLIRTLYRLIDRWNMCETYQIKVYWRKY